MELEVQTCGQQCNCWEEIPLVNFTSSEWGLTLAQAAHELMALLGFGFLLLFCFGRVLCVVLTVLESTLEMRLAPLLPSYTRFHVVLGS